MSVTKIWLLLTYLYHLPRKRVEKSTFDNEWDQSLASPRMLVPSAFDSEYDQSPASSYLVMPFTYKMHGEVSLW